MKTIYKVLISFVIGICLILAGIGIGGIRQMKVPQFSFLEDFQLVWSAEQKDDIQYKVSSTIEKLKLNTTMADVEFYEKDNIDQMIITVNNVYSGFDIKEEDHLLEINQPHYWFVDNDSRKAKIKIGIPKGYQFNELEINANIGTTTIQNINVKDLSVENSMGKLTMDNIICQNMKIDAGMSQTNLSQVICQNQLDIDLGMGDVTILLNTKKVEYTYSVDVGMGSVQIGDEKFSGFVERDSHHNDLHDNHIHVDCGMGSVKIEMEE